MTTRKNFSKWSISQSSAYSFCLQSETLQHIVSSCKLYLGHGRYAWRHDSVLNSIAKTFSTLPDCSLYADLPAFISLSFITGSAFRPDLLLITKEKVLYILELTIGCETNTQINSERKASKHYPLQQTLLQNYKQIKFINLFMGALGTIRSSSESLIDFLKSLSFNDKVQKQILSNLINITIRTPYFIFSCRNKPWTSPDLLNLLAILSIFLFHFIIHSVPLKSQKFFSFLFCYVVNLTASCTLPSFRETYDCILLILKMLLKLEKNYFSTST